MIFSKDVDNKIITFQEITACLVWGQVVVLREYFYMSVG